MKPYIEARTIEISKYIIETKCTIREAAKRFGISKSVVHKDINERLEYLDAILYKKTVEILKINDEEKHLRGGISTKKRYSKVEH